jgi:ketosteroid isomerase-like protein
MKIKGIYTLRRRLVPLVAALAPLLAHAGPVDDLLAADTAFAARAGESGQHVAFAEYLAPDGILFRPEAVGGQQWLAGNEPATGRLEWWPSAAAVDCSGRLGVSTGPWRYSNAAGGEPVAGHYLSVWRRDDDGQWRVVLDHGIDHPSGAVPAEPLQAVLARWWPAPGSGTCVRRDGTDRLARAEQHLDARVQREGLQEALLAAAVRGALAYRDDAAPRPLAAAADDAPFGRGTVVQAGDTISVPGGDMAVTFGVLRSADGTQRALYVRVWQRERRDWRVAIDVRTPLPAAPDP